MKRKMHIGNTILGSLLVSGTGAVTITVKSPNGEVTTQVITVT